MIIQRLQIVYMFEKRMGHSESDPGPGKVHSVCTLACCSIAPLCSDFEAPFLQIQSCILQRHRYVCSSVQEKPIFASANTR